MKKRVGIEFEEVEGWIIHDPYDKVYPIIDHGYQFSVSLAIYH